MFQFFDVFLRVWGPEWNTELPKISKQSWAERACPLPHSRYWTPNDLSSISYAFWRLFALLTYIRLLCFYACSLYCGCCCSLTQSCPNLWDPMDCSTLGSPVLHYLLEFAQTHDRQVGDAIQPSHLQSSPSPPAPNHSQHESLFQ